MTELKLERIIENLEDKGWQPNISAINTLSDVIDFMTLNQIVPLLKNKNWQIKAVSANAIWKILVNNPSLATEKLLEQITLLLKDKELAVIDCAIRVIEKIVDIEPNFANKALLEQIMLLPKHDFWWYVTKSHINTILDKVLTIDKSLITPFLQDEDESVREAANHFNDRINTILKLKGE